MFPASPPSRVLSRSFGFYSWRIVAAGFTLLLLGDGLLNAAFGVYFVALQTEFGWTNAVLAGLFSMYQLLNGLLAPLQGWLTDRFGPRAVLRAGVIALGAGMVLWTISSSILVIYLTFFIAAVGATLAGYLTISIVVARWFHARRAFALGITFAGWGAAGALVTLLAQVVERYGWRPAALLSGVLAIVIGLPVAQWIHASPEACGQLPDGIASATSQPVETATTPSEQAAFAVSEALREPAFWLINLGHMLAYSVLIAILAHLVPHLVSHTGFSLKAASGVMAALTTAEVVGLLLGGFMGDRVNMRLLIVAAVLAQGIAITVLAYAAALPVLVAAAILFGVGFGMRTPPTIAIRASYFGRASFAGIMGLSGFLLLPASFLGPLFAGYLADQLGDYHLAFVVLAGASVLSAFCFAIARKPVLRRRRISAPAI